MKKVRTIPSTVSERIEEAGFTLIELSIVLVIIGLIVGGVLVGQDLIKAARIRATISQVEKYNTEVNTFLGKFGGLPGDLSSQAATNFGMTGVYLLDGAQGHGDGSGVIEDGACGAGGANANGFCGEISSFWAQLSWANMIDGAFGANSTTGTGVPATAATTTNMSLYVPPAKLGTGYSFTVFSGSGYNFYGLFDITGISTAGVITVGATGITPIIAQNIDAKLDDGAPNTGLVRALAVSTAPIAPATTNTLFSPYGMTGPSHNASAALTACTIDPSGTVSASDTYNLSAALGGNSTLCDLAFRFN